MSFEDFLKNKTNENKELRASDLLTLFKNYCKEAKQNGRSLVNTNDIEYYKAQYSKAPNKNFDSTERLLVGGKVITVTTFIESTNLTGVDLTGADLHDANLIGADLTGANLQGANLTAAVVCRADLTGADLQNANLTGADLHGANLIGASLQGANLQGAYLVNADLSYANLTGADLTKANLNNAMVGNANLSRANLKKASLASTTLLGARLHDANLTEANLVQAELTYANLTGANLQGANLNEAVLCKTNLSKADLTDANASNADLGGANLHQARLLRTNFSNAGMKNSNLSGAFLYETNFTDSNLYNVNFSGCDLSKVSHSVNDFETKECFFSLAKIPDRLAIDGSIVIGSADSVAEERGVIKWVDGKLQGEYTDKSLTKSDGRKILISLHKGMTNPPFWFEPESKDNREKADERLKNWQTTPQYKEAKEALLWLYENKEEMLPELSYKGTPGKMMTFPSLTTLAAHSVTTTSYATNPEKVKNRDPLNSEVKSELNSMNIDSKEAYGAALGFAGHLSQEEEAEKTYEKKITPTKAR